LTESNRLRLILVRLASSSSLGNRRRYPIRAIGYLDPISKANGFRIRSLNVIGYLDPISKANGFRIRSLNAIGYLDPISKANGFRIRSLNANGVYIRSLNDLETESSRAIGV
jgi:hypothetical protein